MHGVFFIFTILVCCTLSWQDTEANLAKIHRWFFSAQNICREDDLKYEETAEDNRLVRLNGVKVGHVQDLQLVDGRIHRVVTRSLRPLLFEIPEFLSPDECDHLIQIAQKEHFYESETVYGKGNGSDREVFEKKMSARDLPRQKATFCSTLLRSFYDSDKNGRINLQELIRYIDEEKYIYPTITDAMPIFRRLDLDLDGAIDREECINLNNSGFVEFLYQIEKLRSLPRYFIRFSESTWIPTNNSGTPFVKRLQERIVKLTRLSKHLVQGSEPIQVVRYSVFGHYNVHYDTTDDIRGRKECCKGSDYINCHMCRFVTIILYLNNVAKGGETAFPVADDPARYAARNFSITLSQRCHQANLVIKPKKGTAIMWYNHFLEYDGADHMTAIDRLTLHGGCDVIKGVKWIANVWLNAPWKKEGKS